MPIETDHLTDLAVQAAADIQNIVASHLPPPPVDGEGQPHAFGAFAFDYKSLARQLAKSLIPLVLQAALSQIPAGTGIDGVALSAAISAQLDKLLS